MSSALTNSPDPGIPDPPSEPTPSDMGERKGGVAPWVFCPALGLVVAFVALTLLFTDTASEVFSDLNSTIVQDLGWYYVLLIAAFVVFSIWVGVGRFGSIRLGRDDDEPEFSLLAWFAMLFATGMGIGLVFWGVAEPLNHFASPRPGFSGNEVQTAQHAITQSYIHWGVHAWGIYVVAGLGIAYAVHRRNRPVSIRWALEPLLGDRVRGGLGNAIDVVAIVGTLFGVATSLGLGVLQISAGLDFLDWFSDSRSLQIILICIITAVATTSVVSGLDKGIKWLSNSNMVIAAVVLLAVLFSGPTLFLLRDFVQSLGNYLENVLRLTFDVSAFQGEAGQAWQAGWTTYYWGWWMSWAPFVGVFIARISRGRTVREFVGGVLLVPTVVTFLWFSVMGGSALYDQLFGEGRYVGADGSVDTETTLFTLLEQVPGGVIWVVVGIILITLFFVTSSDSGSLVVDMLSSGGDPNPPRWSRVLWALLEGATAIALLAAGGLSALQTGAIITALPFSFVLIGIMFALAKAFKGEIEQRRRLMRQIERREMSEHVTDRVLGELGTVDGQQAGSQRLGAGAAGPRAPRRH